MHRGMLIYGCSKHPAHAHERLKPVAWAGGFLTHPGLEDPRNDSMDSC